MENNLLPPPPTFLSANCARGEDGRECFTLYFHSCLISFLNSVRVGHRNSLGVEAGSGLCCYGLKITLSSQTNLSERRCSPRGGGRVLRAVFLEWLTLSSLWTTLPALIWYSIVSTGHFPTPGMAPLDKAYPSSSLKLPGT